MDLPRPGRCLVTEFTGFDIDELRGQDWMRSLPRMEHAALAIAVNGGQHVFQARCSCRWEGPVRRWTGQPGERPLRGRNRGVLALNTELWLRAVVDADEHMQVVAGRLS